MNLLPFQKNHADKLIEALNEKRVALDASDPGTGKTYVACHVAKQQGRPVYIITPKSTVPSWRAVAEGFGVNPELIINYESLRTGKNPACEKVGQNYIWHVSPDALLIFDEAQNCKGQDSLNSKLLIAAKRQRLRILLCSATAASNPLEMKALGFALGLHSYADYWRWAHKNGVRDGMFGKVFLGDHDDLKRIHSSIFPAKGSRLKISEIPEFPDTLIESLPIETGKSKAIQKIYDKMAKDLVKAERTRDKEKLNELASAMSAVKANHVTILLRARQAIELYKVDAMVEMAKSAMSEGMSVVLLVNFNATIDLLCEKLNCSATIRGDQNPLERQNNIEAFQNNETHCIIANIKAGGVGVSLHDPSGKRPRLSLISPSFSAAELRQALGRVHRSGGAASVQKIIFAAGTCEEHTARVCAEKLAHIDMLNDGDLSPFPL